MPRPKSQFVGEILHFNAARLRVTGSGSLKLYLRSLDEVKSSTLPTITMAATNNIEPTVLADYIDQMGYLEFGTTEINETFIVCKIVIFVKPVASGYPQ